MLHGRLRSGPIHRGIREDRGAVVDGGTRRTGWPGGGTRMRSVYLHSSIEAAGSGAFGKRSTQAGRWWMTSRPCGCSKRTRPAEVLSELTNRPGTPWDGATGSGMNWRLAVSELEAERRNLRLDGEPVVLYSLLSPPGSARSNLLSDLYRLDATLTVTLEWRPQRLDAARRKIRGAQRHYFSKALLDERPCSRDGGKRRGYGGHSGGGGESDRLGDALVELETDGVAYGDLALTDGDPRPAGSHR